MKVLLPSAYVVGKCMHDSSVSRIANSGFAIVVAAFMVTGCNGGKTPTYAAGGKVTFSDSTPLTNGFVIFRSLDDDQHPSARASIQADGSFELSTFASGDGAVAGKHQVLVTTPPPGGRPGFESPAGPGVDMKFSSYETSGLEFTVSDDPSQNRFEIVVEKDR